MSSVSTPVVTISPANGAKTMPLYSVYAIYDGDPRSYCVGSYLKLDDAKAALQAQIINGAALSIYETDVTDRTAG